jgi:predicted nucleic acid-binding protein
MSVVVVDASVVIKWFVPENGTEEAPPLLALAIRLETA